MNEASQIYDVIINKAVISDNKLSPIIKWAGGKGQELKFIKPAMPLYFEDYYEPFVGGGAVYFSIQSNQKYINDKSSEFIELYQMVKTQNKEFLSIIRQFSKNWSLLENLVTLNSYEFSKVYYNYFNNNINFDVLKSFILDFISKNSVILDIVMSLDLNINASNFINEISKNFLSKIQRMKKIGMVKRSVTSKRCN